jgi:hypothetical protein
MMEVNFVWKGEVEAARIKFLRTFHVIRIRGGNTLNYI